MADSIWGQFWRDSPGRRFSRRYERLRHHNGTLAGRLLRAALAIVLLLVGLVMLPLPGPGFVPLLLGAALLAGESIRIASWLDRAEVRVRRWLGRPGRG
jgi:hypothetical protein